MEKIRCMNCSADNLSNAKYCSRCGFELQKTSVELSDAPLPTANAKKKINKRTIIGFVIGFIAYFIVYYGIQELFFKRPSFDKIMMEAASEINKTCPFMIDAETRLDNAISLPENIFQYNYTLVNMDKKSADTIALKNYLEPALINSVKTNPQMELQRKHRVTLNYNYKDKNRVYLFMVSITPDKYQ